MNNRLASVLAFSLFGTLAFAVACGSGGGGHHKTTIKFDGGAVKKPDLADPNNTEQPDLKGASKPDLTQPTSDGLTCSGYLDCLNACDVSDTACQDACDAQVSPTGQQLFTNVIACIQDYCLNTSKECKLDAAGTKLIDNGTTGACSACLGDTPSLQACDSEYQACVNN